MNVIKSVEKLTQKFTNVLKKKKILMVGVKNIKEINLERANPENLENLENIGENRKDIQEDNLGKTLI
jgi:hypothetical protein